MSCAFCERHELSRGGEGSFYLMRGAVRSGCALADRPILCYVASCEVFGTDVEVEDWVPVSYCPMCGERLEADK